MKPSPIERFSPDSALKWRLTPCVAPQSRGIGVLVIPGGGYGNLATGHEGEDIAAWLNARGYDAWILEYRVAGAIHAAPLGDKPLEDAREALSHVLQGANDEADVGNTPRKIGVWGFSAGGHLAASLATEPDTPLDFVILAYPVISLEPGFTHGGSRRNLLGEAPDEALASALSAHNRVSATTPPTFIFHTGDDPAVPVENALLFYSALRKHRIPAELHIYETGRHGVGLAPDNKVLRSWADRLEDWLERR